MIFLGGMFVAGVALFIASVIMGQELDANCGSPTLRKYNTAISTMGAVLASGSMAFLIAERNAPSSKSPHSLIWKMLITILCATIMVLAIVIRGEIQPACTKVRNISTVLMWAAGGAAIVSLGTIGYGCRNKDTEGN